MLLFVATVASVLATSTFGRKAPSFGAALADGVSFTGTLLGILLVHELAHYVAARAHRVDASLPYFIPMPMISIFGTMGAVIRMRGTIPTRKALLDIGASGPLAGLVVAIPLYFLGAKSSAIVAIASSPDSIELGEPLLVKALDQLARQVPAGMELSLSPMAFGAWAGMFVTMINLVPVGQLDGGHVAYALFGPRQDRIARIVHRSTLVFFALGLMFPVIHDLRAGLGFVHFGRNLSNALFWLVWFELLAILGHVSSRSREAPAPAHDPRQLGVGTRALAIFALIGLAELGASHPSWLVWVSWFVGLALLLAMERRGGALGDTNLLDHPPTGEGPLDGKRKAIAWFTLIVFVLLFMPAPITR